jgi:hypothetical protein
MNPTEEFRKFASECRATAKFARSSESKATWDRLAARWVRCAELNELRSSAAAHDRMARQRRRPSIAGPSAGKPPEPADLFSPCSHQRASIAIAPQQSWQTTHQVSSNRIQGEDAS